MYLGFFYYVLSPEVTLNYSQLVFQTVNRFLKTFWERMAKKKAFFIFLAQKV